MPAALLLLGACGGSGGDAETSSPTPTQTPFTSSPTPQIKAFQYEVQPGDSVSYLAERFGTTADEIIALNHLQQEGAIYIGQVLLIPGDPPPDLPSPAVTTVPLNPVGAGLLFPIEGACLPNNDRLMPNAPREYRAGIHEGVDFYAGYNCATVVEGTPVMAVKDGKIIRADHNFVEMTEEQLNELLARSKAQGYTDADALDRFRGRQVWIDHGNGLVTRYCHLSGIPPEIQTGVELEAGVVVGFVGDSGTPEAVTAPGTEIHLHFEIRVGDSFLGEGLPPDQVRMLYDEVFSQP